MARIAIINDEISDSLEEAVAFAEENRVAYLELRSIRSKNILDIPVDQLTRYSRYLKRHGIRVSSIASPIYKWLPPGEKTTSTMGIDSFYLKSTRAPYSQLYTKALRVAEIFDCPNVRIFSFLKYRNFKQEDLLDELSILSSLARKKNITLLLENEPVCNIDGVEDMLSLMSKANFENLRVLLDIGNLFKSNKRLPQGALDEILKFVSYIHLKDFDVISGKYVPLGDGRINYKRYVSQMREHLSDKTFYSIETHADGSKLDNTKKSLSALRELLSQRRVKYGIVGCGRIFNKHIAAIKNDKNAELLGVFDINKKRASTAAKINDCIAFKDLDSLIEETDVVNVCTPHSTHVDIVQRVIRQGKYCLVEKPGMLNKDELYTLKSIPNYRKKIFIIFQNRYNPAIECAEKNFKTRTFGKLLYIAGNVRWHRDKKYYCKTWRGKRRYEGGILYNQGIHTIDLMMRHFPSGRLKIISAFKEKIYHRNIDTEDIFLAQFKKGNTLFNLEVSVVNAPRDLESSLYYVGEKGRIKIGGKHLNIIENIELVDQGDFNLPGECRVGLDDIYGFGHGVLIKRMSTYVLRGAQDKNLVTIDEASKRIDFINKLYAAANKKNIAQTKPRA